MTEKIYIVSDIEMGRKDVTDDFADDELTADFIDIINTTSPADTKVTLLLNGDIFDFLKMAYKEEYPRYITEEISLWKMKEVLSHHPLVFDAFRRFLDHPSHFIHFLIGNHDADLIWPALQKHLREYLGHSERISFSYSFSTPELHVEHGDQFDFFFEYFNDERIITYKNKQILNLPWGTYSCFSHWVPLKRKYPEIEKVYPKHLAIREDRKFYWKSFFQALDVTLRYVVINPVVHFSDPTYRFPHLKLLKHTLRYGLEFIDEEKFLKARIHMALDRFKNKKIIALSHFHMLTALETEKQKVFITDTWRDERSFYNREEKKLKSFIEIDTHNGQITDAALKTWKGERNFSIVPVQKMK